MSSRNAHPANTEAGASVSYTGSLASHLMGWYACSAFSLVLAASGLLYWGLTHAFEYGDDGTLVDRVNALRWALQHRKDAITEIEAELQSEWEELTAPHIYLRVVGDGQKIIVESRQMARLLPVGSAPTVPESGKPTAISRIVGPSGRAFRAMAAPVTGTQDSDRWTMQIALDITEEQEVLQAYRIALSSILLGSAFISLVFGYRITQKGLRPLADIIWTTTTIGSSTLNERIHAEGLPAELRTLATNFNNMLQRLDESFGRLSRFSGDIAHELRTPINVLRGEAEVALSKPRSPEEYRRVLVSCLAECSEMTRIVDALLFMARAEHSIYPLNRESVEVGPELENIVDFYEAAASEKGVDLRWQSPNGLTVNVDRVLFRRALSNLVANAVMYTPSGGSVLVTASANNGAVRIDVSDTGIGIDREHLKHVFDRFQAVGRPRITALGGTGLGLGIVKSVMAAHHGTVSVTSERGVGTCVTTTFPDI